MKSDDFLKYFQAVFTSIVFCISCFCGVQERANFCAALGLMFPVRVLCSSGNLLDICKQSSNTMH